MPTISEIIGYAKISQYLAELDRAKLLFFRNGNVPTQNLPDLIYQVRKSVECIYINNSEDENLQANANYLYNLCNKYIKKSIEIYG
jgi:hypothetical protein